MNIKLIKLLVMAIITSFSVNAQDFQQPYPIGEAIKGNPILSERHTFTPYQK